MAPEPLPSLAELASLEGRGAVVTGAGRGIGAAVVTRLREAGAAVLAADIAPPDDQDHDVVGVDLREPEAPAQLAQAALERLGRLDIWVNNAGIYPSAHVLQLGDEEWRDVLELNLGAAFRGAREAARLMVHPANPASGGVIVNVVSNAGMAAGPASAHYVSSKHGLAGLTKALAVDLAPSGIRVVGIAPGVTRTEGIEEAMVRFEEAGWGDLESYTTRTTPLGRMATPDEIARVVLFAASELASYVTGTTIVVDGGQLTSFT